LEFYFITLFPEIFSEVLKSSLLGRACEQALVSFHTINLRNFAKNNYGTVDDAPFGGGPGMLLKADVLYAAWENAKKALPAIPEKDICTILLSPQGKLLKQEAAKKFLNYKRIILICGHYEGVDERFIEKAVDQEISIGDYILTGGEVPAMVLVDVVTRLLPGVVGNPDSVQEESLENGLLKYPQYTRPRTFKGIKVPDVLLGGNHKEIEKWRINKRKERTRTKRPDLWKLFNEKQKNKPDKKAQKKRKTPPDQDNPMK